MTAERSLNVRSGERQFQTRCWAVYRDGLWYRHPQGDFVSDRGTAARWPDAGLAAARDIARKHTAKVVSLVFYRRARRARKKSYR